MKRTVFFISDGTGITAQTLGHSLITQFDQIEFAQVAIPYIDTPEKAHAVFERINLTHQQDGQKPLVFSTLVNANIYHIIQKCTGLCLDFFQTFIVPLEVELNTPSSHSIGRSHSSNKKAYTSRIDAINFTLSTDDGINTHQYKEAELILVGVSRSGKTPTSLYLALQYGIRTANYPITEEDFDAHQLPKILLPYRQKLFGLTIEPNRLHAIRTERRPSSRYASLEQCQHELRIVEQLFMQANIPYLNTTKLSIEEIATKIMVSLGIERQLL